MDVAPPPHGDDPPLLPHGVYPAGPGSSSSGSSFQKHHKRGAWFRGRQHASRLGYNPDVQHEVTITLDDVGLLRHRSLLRSKCSKCCRGPSEGKAVRVLAGITAEFRAGEMVCLLGDGVESGTGALLDVLAGRVDGGKRTGRVKLDGHSVSRQHVRAVSNYVPRADPLYASLTVRETLEYIAELRLPPSWSVDRKSRRVNKLVTLFGLGDVADAKVGTYNGGGGGGGGGGEKEGEPASITRGERKRLSVALDLITNPSMLFLEEPAADLDARSAIELFEVLRQVADAGCIVVATLQRPAAAVFRLCDRLLLLQRGEMAYSGHVEDVVPYLAVSFERRNHGGMGGGAGQDGRREGGGREGGKEGGSGTVLPWPSPRLAYRLTKQDMRVVL